MSDKTKIAITLFDKYAQKYQEKYMNVDLYQESLDIFCSSIKKDNPQILELACGPGNITKYLLNKRPDFQLMGIDLAPNMIVLAKINNPTAEFRIMDCRDILLLEKKYEAIMCGFCLPYLSKEESIQLIKDASLLIKPKGLFFISTMEGDYSKSGFENATSNNEEKMFIHYHQADYLTEALKKNDLSIIYCDRKNYSTQNNIAMTDLIIIAQK